MNTTIRFVFASLLVLGFTSCDKGYDLRFTNYYLEPMDSVIVGDNVVVFRDVEIKANTNYTKIKHGDYDVLCISHTKKKFTTKIQIPKKGSGKRTLQIDGLGTFVLLEQ